ncbi:MAG: RNA methyltransferase [Anaerolineae bacterium]|jgi:TrmH family RNA methyltransferase|nr:RNA methyltransferase [Anaerolineae bacterium]
MKIPIPSTSNRPNELTSVQNARVKQWVALGERKYRQKTRSFRVEGARLVTEALLTGQPIEAIIYCESCLRTQRARHLVQAAPSDIVWRVSEEIVARLSTRNRPGEVFCVCKHLDVPLDALPRQGRPFFVVLDEPQGPGNLGTTLRTAEGAGADAVVIIEPAVDLYHPGVVKATVGSLFGLPIARAPSVQAFLDWYDRTWDARPDTRWIAAIPEAEKDYGSLDDLDRPVFVVFGNEQRGLAPELRRRAHLEVSIRMLGRADSLNTSSAAAVIICDIVRKRGRGRFAQPQHLRRAAGLESPGKDSP